MGLQSSHCWHSVVLRRNSLNQTRITMAELGLKKKEVDAIEFAFDVYDFKGDGKADVFPMYKACKDSKDQGGFHDFVEILKLYDKNDDNTMLAHELFRLLTNLGEKLTK